LVKAATPKEKKLALAYKLSHLILIGIAAAAFLICLHPPKLLGIFGQVGVYGMAVAALPPLLIGVLFRQPSLKLVWAASFLGLAAHFLLFFFGAKLFPNSNLAFANPGVTATLAIIVSIPLALTGSALAGLTSKKTIPLHLEK